MGWLRSRLIMIVVVLSLLLFGNLRTDLQHDVQDLGKKTSNLTPHQMNDTSKLSKTSDKGASCDMSQLAL